MCVARVLPVVRLGVMNCTGGWGWLLVGLLGWVDFEILEKTKINQNCNCKQQLPVPVPVYYSSLQWKIC
jgi:hypothetical protein